MKHILAYKLFQERLGDYFDKDKIKDPELRKLIQSNSDFEDENLITSVIISNSMNSNNKFGIKYSNIVNIEYNNSEEHSLIGNKRLTSRTNMRNVSEFNDFLKKAIKSIFPECFFNDVEDINVFEPKNIDNRYKKMHVIAVNDLQHDKKYYIPFVISKKYNSINKSYVFYIYIITINPLNKNNQYKTYYIDVSELGDVVLTDIVENDEYVYTEIPIDISIMIDKKNNEEKELINADKILSTQSVKADTITNKPPKNILNTKNIKNIIKKK